MPIKASSTFGPEEKEAKKENEIKDGNERKKAIKLHQVAEYTRTTQVARLL
jgi:hypothetical protein